MSHRINLKQLVVIVSLTFAHIHLHHTPNCHAQESSAQDIQTILSVDHFGQGNDKAIAALKSLRMQRGAILPELYEAMNQANPVSRNWLKSAIDDITSSSLTKNQSLPVKELKAFLEDQANHPVARQLAFSWLSKIEPDYTKTITPGLITDNSDALRRVAVSYWIKQAESSEGETTQKSHYQKALSGATDKDQVDQIADSLEALGTTIDLQKHYGFLTQWSLIGPFDNTDESGFNIAYPPETELNKQSQYDGKLGPVTWQSYSTDDPLGTLSIKDQVAHHKGAIMYAWGEFECEAERDVEFRLTTPNAWKLWVNGELVFAREEYHRGRFFDQYRIPCQLQAGGNSILLKVCQNEQEQDWAQRWQFQFRVCNPFGMAILPE